MLWTACKNECPAVCSPRMKSNRLVTLITFAAALALSGCRDPVAPQASEQETKTPEIWEYKVQKIYLTAGNLEALRMALNKEGDEGWALVSATPLDPIENNYSASPLALGIFKRAKRLSIETRPWGPRKCKVARLCSRWPDRATHESRFA